jgi:hypothetical protein
MTKRLYLENNSKPSPFLRVDGSETIWLKTVPQEKRQLLDLFSLLAEMC